MPAALFFTDLDGTLLDHHTYDWSPALEGIDLLQKNGGPPVMVSSKTRAEINELQKKMSLFGPYAAENGAVVVIPLDSPLADAPLPETLPVERNSESLSILLGRKRSEIRPFFDQLAARFPMRALSDMSASEAADLTGLTLSQAEKAVEREFGEAFILESPKEYEPRLRAAAEALGPRLTRGGRFYHLSAGSDKGRAVRFLTDLFRIDRPEAVTAATGDAPNDRAMLAAVDRPYLVAEPDGKHREVDVPGLIRVPLPGPAGFTWAVRHCLGLDPSGGAA